jgi:hypothetical protein
VNGKKLEIYLPGKDSNITVSLDKKRIRKKVKETIQTVGVASGSETMGVNMYNGIGSERDQGLPKYLPNLRKKYYHNNVLGENKKPIVHVGKHLVRHRAPNKGNTEKEERIL